MKSLIPGKTEKSIEGDYPHARRLQTDILNIFLTKQNFALSMFSSLQNIKTWRRYDKIQLVIMGMVKKSEFSYGSFEKQTVVEINLKMFLKKIEPSECSSCNNSSIENQSIIMIV